MKKNGSPTDSVKFYDFIFISKLWEGLGGGEGSSPGEGPSPAIQQQEVSPGGAGEGAGPWERGGGGVTPGFSLETELKRQNKTGFNSSLHCCS